MKQRVTLYLCDPKKHTECTKTGCVHNPLAKHPFCRSTTHPEFAKLDEHGKPIQSPDWKETLKAEESAEPRIAQQINIWSVLSGALVGVLVGRLVIYWLGI